MAQGIDILLILAPISLLSLHTNIRQAFQHHHHHHHHHYVRGALGVFPVP
jgi:hypothetical protein